MGRHQRSKSMPPFLSSKLRQVSDSHRFSQLFDRREIRGERLTVGKLGGAITAFSVQEIKQAGRAALESVLRNVAVFLGDVEVTGAVEHNDPVIHTQPFV